MSALAPRSQVHAIATAPFRALARLGRQRPRLALAISALIAGASLFWGHDLQLDPELSTSGPRLAPGLIAVNRGHDLQLDPHPAPLNTSAPGLIAVRITERSAPATIASLRALPGVAWVELDEPPPILAGAALAYENTERLRHIAEELEAMTRATDPSVGLDRLSAPYASILSQEESARPANATRYAWLKVARPDAAAAIVDELDRIGAHAWGPPVDALVRAQRARDDARWLLALLALSTALLAAFVFRSIRAAGAVLVGWILAASPVLAVLRVLQPTPNLLGASAALVVVTLGIVFVASWISHERSTPSDDRGVLGLTAGWLAVLAGWITVAIVSEGALEIAGLIGAAGTFALHPLAALSAPSLATLLRLGTAVPTPGPYARILPRWAPAVFWAAAVVLFGAWVHAPRIQLDRELPRSVPAPNPRVDAVARAPVIVTAASEQEARRVARMLRRRSDALGPRTPAEVVLTRSDLAPDPAPTAALRARIANAAEQLLSRDVPQAQLRRIERFKALAEAPVPTEATAPAWLLRTLESNTVLVVPKVDARAEAVASFAPDLPLGPDRTLSGEGPAPLNVAASDAVVAALRRALPIALIAAFVLLALFLGVRGALFVVLPAAGAVAAALGAAFAVGFQPSAPELFSVLLAAAASMVVAASLVAIGDESAEAALSAHASGVAPWFVGLGALPIAVLISELMRGAPVFGARIAAVSSGMALACVLFAVAPLLYLGHIRRARQTQVGLHEPRSNRRAADLATSFCAGYSPVAPGTFGAVACIPVGWALDHLHWLAVAPLLTLATVWSIFVGRRYLAGGTPDLDPKEVVLDETLGVAIAFAFVPFDWVWAPLAFIFFRFFDIAKPGPIGWIDKNVKGGAGIMLDDVAAGLFAGALLALARGLLIHFGIL